MQPKAFARHSLKTFVFFCFFWFFSGFLWFFDSLSLVSLVSLVLWWLLWFTQKAARHSWKTGGSCLFLNMLFIGCFRVSLVVYIHVFGFFGFFGFAPQADSVKVNGIITTTCEWAKALRLTVSRWVEEEQQEQTGTRRTTNNNSCICWSWAKRPSSWQCQSA